MQEENIPPTEQHLEIVTSFSQLEIPGDLVDAAKIPAMIADIQVATAAMKSKGDTLQSRRREKADGNFIGNWWKDRDEYIREAELDLNSSIGNLSEKTSILIVVNCAVSKMLSEQQHVLIAQQSILREQAGELLKQNQQIQAQQKVIEGQQVEINATNQKLLDATKLTNTQAKELIHCIDRVVQVEQSIESAVQGLRNDVEAHAKQQLQRARLQTVAVIGLGLLSTIALALHFIRP
ncbi:hypothetical protein [Rugamonas rivuli]|uniref:Uncharacterized protein n=1 Tax=Rugamonas rivuli TaxID=2743358 RepID=A0A843SBB0_9BURK|nr:hypothetical protein [Rugamonas rivuli]MQA19491.1 hypothetical protein [Rugamonas rivuli]